MLRVTVGKHIVLLDDEDSWLLDYYNLVVEAKHGTCNKYWVVCGIPKEWGKNALHKKPIHHMLLPKKEGYLIDHRSRNTLNNRKSNLRYVTYAQNSRNRSVTKVWNGRKKSSKYLGVCKPKGSKRWYAHIRFEGKKYNLGYHANEEDAARVRDKKAIELHGSFASLNFPKKKLIKRM